MIAPNSPVWDDEPDWVPLSPLDGDAVCDVCVVGLGGSGLVAVRALRAHGVNVIGLDAHDAGAGAAGRNGGLLLAGLADFHHDAVRTLGHGTAEALYRRTLAELDELLQTLQDQLFTVGAVLATPSGSKAEKVIPKVKAQWVTAMEQAIDGFDAQLAPLTSFILPGGSKAACALHLARTVCRRAERRTVPLLRAGKIGPEVVVYLNRLSDLLFTMARFANLKSGVADVPWRPAKDPA